MKQGRKRKVEYLPTGHIYISITEAWREGGHKYGSFDTFRRKLLGLRRKESNLPFKIL